MDINRLLLEATDTDEETRASALDELLLQMNDEIAQALLDIAESNAADEVRSDAITTLGPAIEECGDEYDPKAEFDFGPEFGPPVSREAFALMITRLRRLYDDKNQPTLIRRRVLEVLVRDPQKWQSKEIRQLLASPDSDWRLTALFAAGFVKGFEPELTAAVQTTTEPHLREAVIAAGRMGVQSAADRIRELAISRKADLDLRIAAIEALPHVDPDSFEILEKLSQSKQEEIAAAAEYALEELGIFSDEEDAELKDFDDE